MNVNIGLQKNDIPNGYSTICEWLKYDGIYEKINLYENFESIRTEELDNKSESYANSLAENWSLNILQ